MEFEIPTTPLGQFNVQALTDLGAAAAAEFEQMRSTLTADSVTDEHLDHMAALTAFCASVDTELSARADRLARFTTLTAEPPVEEPAPADAPAEPAPIEEPAPAAVTAATVQVTSPSVQANTPSVAQIATQIPAVNAPQMRAGSGNYTIFAAADVPDHPNGAELESYGEVAELFLSRTRGYGGNSPLQHGVARIRRDFGDWAIDGDDANATQTRIDELLRTWQQDEGAQVAGVGWCAPSETVYTTCSQITATGGISLPEIGARRGGIRHNQGIEFDTIFGSGTGFNILTEAQVIADTVKTCVAIPCPSFVDDRLKVSVLCLTGDILQNRGYPEFVSTFVEAAIATNMHNVNRQIIADIVAGSTAVSLATSPTLTADASVVSQVLSAVEIAVWDIRYRLRLDPNATIDIVLPYWLLGQMRADWIRRNAAQDPQMADAQMSAAFAMRGARVQYVYDWQDAFSGVAGNPGDDTPIVSLPTSLSFLAFPAGTWVLARQDVIRLDSIYDSTNITTNKVTQLFLEDGFRAMRFCPLSRVYTVGICPSGDTGAQRSVDCVTP